MKDFNELEHAISNIIKIYNEICDEWNEILVFKEAEFAELLRFNHSKTTVSDLDKKSDILLTIFFYRECLNKFMHSKLFEIEKNETISSTRIKSFNSTYAKYQKYLHKQVIGKAGSMPVSKCFNDLYGLRIVTQRKFTFNL